MGASLNFILFVSIATLASIFLTKKQENLSRLFRLTAFVPTASYIYNHAVLFYQYQTAFYVWLVGLLCLTAVWLIKPKLISFL